MAVSAPEKTPRSGAPGRTPGAWPVAGVDRVIGEERLAVLSMSVTIFYGVDGDLLLGAEGVFSGSLLEIESIW